jgi:hypothetical protein
MLGEVVQLQVPVGDDHLRFTVVFGVVGPQARILVAHVHVAVGVENLPNLPLLIGFESRLAAGRKGAERSARGLLGGQGSRRRKENERQRRKKSAAADKLGTRCVRHCLD